MRIRNALRSFICPLAIQRSSVHNWMNFRFAAEDDHKVAHHSGTTLVIEVDNNPTGAVI